MKGKRKISDETNIYMAIIKPEDHPPPPFIILMAGGGASGKKDVCRLYVLVSTRSAVCFNTEPTRIVDSLQARHAKKGMSHTSQVPIKPHHHILYTK